MNRRMLTTLVALVGVFVALYLAMYKAGVIGTLACGGGECETVQSSKWADFIGIPVAVWGVGYYLLVFALALAGTAERWAESRTLPLALVLLTGWGVLFSAWLTYLELFVIHAICRWCVVSAVIAVVLFGLAVLDWRAARRA
ncbi:MAG TPA: vitamin K epoxide reductase family protein [Gemmatimonadaceae bacterium]|nr:vitamin K epoxide reductase family protein [Gemmatimonadaceae bacterium]